MRARGRPLDPWEVEDFIEDYKFLIDSGRTNSEIAARMGLTVEALGARIKRLGIWYPEKRYRLAAEHLEELIRRGGAITMDSFPHRIPEDSVQAILQMAVRAKKIVDTKVKIKNLTGNNVISVYLPA